MKKEFTVVGAYPAMEKSTVDPLSQEAKKECGKFLKLIRKIHGHEPKNTELTVHLLDLDSGWKVICKFDNTDPDSKEYAFRCEGNPPTRWE